MVPPLDWDPHPGFGIVTLTRDGVEVRRIVNGVATVADFETLAAEDPDRDWRFEVYGPLSGAVFQRHDEEKWVLVESNKGFA